MEMLTTPSQPSAPPLLERGVPAAAMGAHPPAQPAAALDRLIQAESIVWLTSVSADGRPYVVPIWFSWDGRSFLIFSKPDARKVRNIRSNPAVMLALGDAAADFDVLLVEGSAEVLGSPTAEIAPESHYRRYADRMAAIGLSRDEYRATYSLPIRVRPTRFLGWSGRSHLEGRRRATTAR